MADAFVGIESLLGGLTEAADLPLSERSRTPTLLLTLETGFPLIDAAELDKSAAPGFWSLDLMDERKGYL